MDKFVNFVKQFESIDKHLADRVISLYKSIFENSATDVNGNQIIPNPPQCTTPVNPNEYFDQSTSADPETVAQSEQAKYGYRTVVASPAGRTSLGIQGKTRSGYTQYPTFSQNSNADTATSSS